MTTASAPVSSLRVWVDAQLPPALATWLRTQGVTAAHVLELGMLSSSDADIFAAARRDDAIVITKDEDFLRLLERHGPPPQVVWVTVGHVRNARLRELIERHWASIAAQLLAGEPLVELSSNGR